MSNEELKSELLDQLLFWVTLLEQQWNDCFKELSND